MSGTKYKGTATYIDWTPSGGTVATVLSAESRTFEVPQAAGLIDVTVRSDTAKANLADFPAISAKIAGLDTSGTAASNQPWDTLNIGDAGTLRWGPEGTATGFRKRTLAAIVKTKNFSSPYDGAVVWDLEFESNGGTVAGTVWP